MDDEDDLFGGPAKKGKGGKGGKQQQAKQADADEEETGGVKTKAQKEKEKKEREKQRKKEQVCLINIHDTDPSDLLTCMCRLLKRRSPLRLRRPQKKRMMLKQLPMPLQPLRLYPNLLVVRRRSCLLVSQHFRSNRKSSASAKKKRSDSGKRSWLVLQKKRD
jgi:hypothetical protein